MKTEYFNKLTVTCLIMSDLDIYNHAQLVSQIAPCTFIFFLPATGFA